MPVVQNGRDPVSDSLLLSYILCIVTRSLNTLETHTLYLFNV